MKRRDFLKLTGGAMATAVATTLSEGVVAAPINAAVPSPQSLSASPAAMHHHRPNILLLMADQLRMDCVGVYGNRDIRTPNLDRLAREGVRFQNAYSSTPTCIPARTELLTGLDPWHNGLLGYANMANKPYPIELPSAMADAGYYTTAIGKNHFYPILNPHGYHNVILNESTPDWLVDGIKATTTWWQRPDYDAWFFSEMPGKDPQATGLGWNEYLAKPFVYPERMHPVHWTGDTVVKFLRSYDRTEPFFLKASFLRPHSPYDAPERFFQLYEASPLPPAKVGAWARKFAPRSGPGKDIWHGKLPAALIRHAREGYYGNVTFVDEQIGRILAVLEERDLIQDTFIIFVADHGDMLGDQNHWRKGYPYEQSSHIPMLLRPTASMRLGPPGQVVTNTVGLRDVLPTLLDVTGTPVPTNVDGRSLLDVIRTGGRGWRKYIELEHNICYSPTNHWNALTDGRWKYIFNALDGSEQLFHLEKDPYELYQLAGVARYNEELDMWRQRLVAYLQVRGSQWVQHDKLIPRPNGMMFSPYFPGYVEPHYRNY